MAASNKLLDALTDADRDSLVAAGSEVDLQAGESLHASRRNIGRVYFPSSAYASIQAHTPSEGLEVMLVGHEGALGGQLVLGVGTQPLETIVQGPGRALRLEGADFLHETARSDSLRSVMHAYVDVMIQQIAISGGCMHSHLLGERLARRLLMTHDCVRRGGFHVTHEFLAAVLGVRRVGVTNAATQLQDDGLISYQRGEVSVLDRAGLEGAACGCYAASRRTYAIAMKRVRAKG